MIAARHCSSMEATLYQLQCNMPHTLSGLVTLCGTKHFQKAHTALRGAHAGIPPASDTDRNRSLQLH